MSGPWPPRRKHSVGRILFVQELGAGLGHVTRLVAVAKHLSDYQRTFAIPELAEARAFVVSALGTNTRIRPAAAIEAGGTNQAPGGTSTLADILFQLGFGDPSAVADVARAWRDILQEVDPDLIVSDFAPALRIVAAGLVPHVVVGCGFTVPPLTTPLPVLYQRPQKSRDSTKREETILSTINAVRRDLASQPFAMVADLFQGDAAFAASLRILDPYRDLRACALPGPFNFAAVDVGPAIEARTGPHIFGYADAQSSAINPLVSALNGIGRPIELFVRNVDASEIARHCAPHIGVHERPAALHRLLPQVRLVIHHGGLGTTSAALLAGTPQVILPTNLEQELTADALAPHGVSMALQIRNDSDPAIVRSLIEDVLDDPQRHRNALSLAKSVRSQHTPGSEHAAVACCKAILEQP